MKLKMFDYDRKIYKLIHEAILEKRLEKFFEFSIKYNQFTKTKAGAHFINGWQIYDMEEEFKRQGVDFSYNEVRLK
jgi:hypothetical protein